ncbi:hypothetical protein DSLASN_09020 [Desulfoluna limicola]|uniref:Uncharacterized protein n=1 Tax=Desulfoluna limicola TaxID=2810562 RepID=A0ABN6F207_9BACT|nr:hypothetical protein DSLASN_09020 [Desulfoluna limicola]
MVRGEPGDLRAGGLKVEVEGLKVEAEGLKVEAEDLKVANHQKEPTTPLQPNWM